MESNDSPFVTSPEHCCDCGCICLSVKNSVTCVRSVKRKYEEEVPFAIPGFIIPQNARIGIENECTALREKVSSQQHTIQDLAAELEEERNASSSATSEAMSMILRLQREKADIQMEARQFKWFAEEKMAHDQEEILELDDLLYKREEDLQSLMNEVQTYKHRMMILGLTEAQADGNREICEDAGITDNQQGEFESLAYGIYPPLRCNLNESEAYNDEADGKCAYEETISPRDQLIKLELRINELERSPRTIQSYQEYIDTENVLEKVIVDDESLEQIGHHRKLSSNSLIPLQSMDEKFDRDLGTDSPKSNNSLKDTGFSPKFVNSNLSSKVDFDSEVGDDLSDRVYTIDSIHQVVSSNNVEDHKAAVGICAMDYKISSRESPNSSNDREIEIQKLYARLHALEVDRESMRQAIVTIGTEKAQLVLLKEIAQNLCKEMSPAEGMPVRKQPVVENFSFLSTVKRIVDYAFWRRKARRSKYNFGLSPNNVGLLMLLDRSPRVGYRRLVSHTSTY